MNGTYNMYTHKSINYKEIMTSNGIFVVMIKREATIQARKYKD